MTTCVNRSKAALSNRNGPAEQNGVILQALGTAIAAAGGGIVGYSVYPYVPELFTPVALRWLGTVFALLWGGILLVLPRLGDLPAELMLSPEEMRRVRSVVQPSVRRLWAVAFLNLACASAFFFISEFAQQPFSRHVAVVIGAPLLIGVFYLVQVPGWLAEIRQFRWKLAERESARRRKQEALRELDGKYEADPRFKKPTL